MLNPWSKFPAIRLTLIFIIGIACHILFPAHWKIALACWLLAWLPIVVFIWFKKLWLRQAALYLPGTSAILLVGASAYLLTFAHTEILSPAHFSAKAQPQHFLLAIVDKPPVGKEKSWRVIVSVKQVVNASGYAQAAKGKLLVSFLKNEQSNQLQYGSILLLPASFQAIEASKNPEQFNYKEFMSFQNVYHQTFLSNSGWQLLKGNAGNAFFRYVYQFRQQLFNQISKHVSTKNELGVASALMLGYNDFITPEITQAYAASGALHVLSVSGLHVGMVYIVLSRMLFFLNKTKRSRLLQTVVIVVLIWMYACLTGLSPSVLRSAAMFSMMAVGKQCSRQPNMFNIIGASALLLMLINPFIMTEVGFKLSYLAVIGIVYLHPKIVSWFSFNNKWAQSIWEVTAVSIAAQATTFPLGLYYFHQFPNLFLVSNLLVIPAGWLLIHSGILLFVLSPFETLQYWVGKFFYWLTFALNKFIFLLEKIPYSIMEGISISAVELLLIYIAVLLCSSLIIVIKAKPLRWLLLIFLLLSLWNGYEYWAQQKQEKTICYSVKGKRAFAAIRGTTAFIDFDSTLLHNESAMLFNIKHHWWKLGINRVRHIAEHPNFYALKNGYVVECNRQRFVMLHAPVAGAMPASTFKTDVLILSGNAKIYMNEILQQYTPKLIVADAGNKSFKVKKWKQAAAQHAIAFYDVAKDGAHEW
ncbi:MAG: ComEC/Rec2 family competence protein [Chitinophagales bacterium]